MQKYIKSNGVMDARDHFKNGVNPKSLMSRGKMLVTFLVLVFYSVCVDAQKITPTIARKLAGFCQSSVGANAYCNGIVTERYTINSIRDLDNFYETLPNRLDISEDLICEMNFRLGSSAFYSNLKSTFSSEEISLMEKVCEPKVTQRRDDIKRNVEQERKEEQERRFKTIVSCEDFTKEGFALTIATGPMFETLTKNVSLRILLGIGFAR